MVALRTDGTDDSIRRLPTRAAKLTMTDGPVFVTVQARASGLYLMVAKRCGVRDHMIGIGGAPLRLKITTDAVTPPIVIRVHKVNMMLSPSTIRLSWVVSSLSTENLMVNTYG